MSIDPEKIRALVSEIRNETGAVDDELVLKRREQRFVYLVENHRPKSRIRRIYLPGAAAALLIAVIGIIRFSSTTASDLLLAYTVYYADASEENAEKAVGQWISAPEAQQAEIRFSNGSRFSISKAGSVRILSHTQRLVHIELYTGKLHAKVKGNGVTEWRINAGPFQLSVVGTQFDVNWNLPKKRLSVQIQEGVVLVNGGSISNHGIRLYAGQSLVADSKDGEYRVATDQSDVTEIVVDSESAETAVYGADSTDGTFREDNEDESPKNIEDSLYRAERHRRKDAWLVHFENDNLEAAKKAVLSSGLPRLLQTAALMDLWKIFQVFRNNGDSKATEEILLQIRKRFPESSKAKISAFILGRIEMEEQNDPQAAAEWFELYIKESPDGSMIQEAYNRLFSAYSSGGETGRARGAASRYLQLFPRGMYVSRARKIQHP